MNMHRSTYLQMYAYITHVCTGKVQKQIVNIITYVYRYKTHAFSHHSLPRTVGLLKDLQHPLKYLCTFYSSDSRGSSSYKHVVFSYKTSELGVVAQESASSILKYKILLNFYFLNYILNNYIRTP